MEKEEEILHTIAQNFMDELLGTFNKEEFLLWMDVSEEPSEQTLIILEERLKQLEYYEHLITLKEYKDENRK